jgi:CheY-like chemotaxis protein
MLASTDYEITEAEDGEQALEAIAKQRPDLILMDIQLPIIDGYGEARGIGPLFHLQISVRYSGAKAMTTAKSETIRTLNDRLRQNLEQLPSMSLSTAAMSVLCPNSGHLISRRAYLRCRQVAVIKLWAHPVATCQMIRTAITTAKTQLPCSKRSIAAMALTWQRRQRSI